MTERIIGAGMDVHTALGCGLPEKLYEEALEFELRERGMKVERQWAFRPWYKTLRLSTMVMDLLVEDVVVIEVKATEGVDPTHLAQLVAYLKAARKPIGLLMNFNVLRLKDGLYRRLNTDAPLPPSTRTNS